MSDEPFIRMKKVIFVDKEVCVLGPGVIADKHNKVVNTSNTAGFDFAR